MKNQIDPVRRVLAVLFLGLAAGVSFTRLLSPPAGATEFPIPVPNIAEIGPARRLTPVTPNNDADLAIVSRGIWVGTGGDLQLTASDDTTPQILHNVASGSTISVRAKRIYSTGTTASQLVLLD